MLCSQEQRLLRGAAYTHVTLQPSKGHGCCLPVSVVTGTFLSTLSLMRLQGHGSGQGMTLSDPYKAVIGICKRCCCMLRWQRIRL